MTDLITRLSASEPTRELADKVLRLYGWTSAGGGWRNPGKQWCLFRPDPLTDLQDAVELVPEGRFWSVDNSCSAFTCVLDSEQQKRSVTVGDAATPATALTIACLKAKEMNDAG